MNTTFTSAPAQPAPKPGRGPDKFLKNDTKEKQRRGGKEKPAESNLLQFAPRMEIQTEKKAELKPAKEPEEKPGGKSCKSRNFMNISNFIGVSLSFQPEKSVFPLIPLRFQTRF